MDRGTAREYNAGHGPAYPELIKRVPVPSTKSICRKASGCRSKPGGGLRNWRFWVACRLWLAKILIYFRNSNLRRTFQISFSVKLRHVPPAAAPFRVTHSPVLFPPRTAPGESIPHEANAIRLILVATAISCSTFQFDTLRIGAFTLVPLQLRPQNGAHIVLAKHSRVLIQRRVAK